MDYMLENLGPERFQEVCHALLAKAFPKTQCFPVGQRDGGRDAVLFFHEQETEGFIIYQVKYVRKPLAQKEPHEWLKEIIKLEAPKVRRLIPRGAAEYYLLTNVPGTALLDTGSIDIVQQILNESFEVPSQCWWRDDLNRRLDDSWNIKWSYPEILSGPDILRYIVENGLSEDAQRRTSVIRTFLRDQFQRETEVRFKQVELQNELLDLFIDVPINTHDADAPRNLRGKQSFVIRAIERECKQDVDRSKEDLMGAATLLLHRLAQEHLNRVVIEGAPGQGKSTIVQYICQTHRQRILNEGMDDNRIPDSHQRIPVRMPFKIDCRDFSLWLNQQNPFSAEETESIPTDWQKSLESFLSAQIKHYSGGAYFSVSDLHAIVRISSVLVVFDGLDEVADISRRRDVVDQISKGVNRLSEIAVSLQAIVTSRPAAFANSPGLPEGTFRYLSLASINRPLIDQYAEKWLKARKIEGRESSDVRRILRDKLDQPHLRELARNPMQLAILLSLIQTRGGSLPDKRTALYDSYVELFFNREAEKSRIVRDHRDLLIDIHGYLAWVLHAESQTERNRGSASAERLRQLVSDYLNNEGQDSSLAHRLFTGMVERVVALVSRVEGTYEFEVQPLREYFAARHLYDTAPYSPSGNPKKGTLPDRFDALSRDFYWQNVTRFYAGCYSKGELPSLVDRLEELARAPGYRNTNHPQSLAATLLADWVFAQHPKSMKQVVALILEGNGLKYISSTAHTRRSRDALVLPNGSGNRELVNRCFELLSEDKPFDYAWMLLDLISANASRPIATECWLQAVKKETGSGKTKWVKYGSLLGVLSNLSDTQVEDLLDEKLENPERVTLLFRGGQRRFVEGDELLCKLAIGHLLDTAPDMGMFRAQSIIDSFSQALSPQRYSMVFRNRLPIPLAALWERVYRGSGPLFSTSGQEGMPANEITDRCRGIVNLSERLAERPAADWATELEPWNQLIEEGRKLFGDRWIFFVLANSSAGIRSKDEKCDDATDLHDRSIPLSRRTRYARLRAGASSWWRSQLELARSQEDIAFTLLILLSWAGPTAIVKNAELINHSLSNLESDWWAKVSDAVRSTSHWFGYERRDIKIDISGISKHLSERLAVALTFRISGDDAADLFQMRLKDYDGDDPIILQFCQRSALHAALDDPKSWQNWLPLVSRSYAKGVVSDPYYGRRFARAIGPQEIPEKTAEEIMDRGDSYPSELVRLAEETCRQKVSERVIPVGNVAERDNWFWL